MRVLHEWKRAPPHQKIKIVVLAAVALMLFLLLRHGGSGALPERPLYWDAAPPPPLKLQYLRYRATGQIGERAMAFATALAIARANGRLLLVHDPVLTAIFDLSALHRDLTDEIPPGLAVDAATHFRENTATRFADHVLRSSADVVDLGIAHDYSAVPIPPSVWSHMLLRIVHRHAASVLVAGLDPYACLHYLVDFELPYLSVNETTLFVTTGEHEQAVRRRLADLLDPHTRVIFAPDSDLRLIENEMWAVGTIGISLAVCAQARTLFLNRDSAFSDLMGALAPSSSRIVYVH